MLHLISFGTSLVLLAVGSVILFRLIGHDISLIARALRMGADAPAALPAPSRVRVLRSSRPRRSGPQPLRAAA